jgi:hypothetical protein
LPAAARSAPARPRQALRGKPALRFGPPSTANATIARRCGLGSRQDHGTPGIKLRDDGHPALETLI